MQLPQTLPLVSVSSGKQDSAGPKPRAHVALGTRQPPLPPVAGSRSERAGRCPVPPQEPAPRGVGDKLLQATEARGGTAARPAACPYPSGALRRCCTPGMGTRRHPAAGVTPLPGPAGAQLRQGKAPCWGKATKVPLGCGRDRQPRCADTCCGSDPAPDTPSASTELQLQYASVSLKSVSLAPGSPLFGGDVLFSYQHASTAIIIYCLFSISGQNTTYQFPDLKDSSPQFSLFIRPPNHWDILVWEKPPPRL